MEESQGWLIDLGMVLIVSIMERQDSSLCVRACPRLPGTSSARGGGSWWGRGVNAQGFANACGQTAAKFSPRREKKAPPARIARVLIFESRRSGVQNLKAEEGGGGGVWRLPLGRIFKPVGGCWNNESAVRL